MKKSELTQLTQIIEQLVRREIKKQLPGIIAETFHNMMGKSQETIVEKVERKDYIGEEVEHEIPKNPHEFRASLKELFAGATPVTKNKLESAPKPVIKQYTKDPVLNQILNETTSDLRARERMTGMAAFQGGYNPGMPATGAGPMMPEAEAPTFAPNMPSMPGNLPASIPIGHPPVLREGQESTHAPLSALPEGVSALDVAKAGAAPAPVTEALTRNYRDMMKLIDQKKGKR